MKHMMYTIYDSKSGIYSKPFYSHNEAIALRSFNDLVNIGDSEVARHPEDFTLFEVGSFEDDTAMLSKFEHLRVIARANEVKKES